MFQRLNGRAGHYALLVATAAALFLVNLGGPSLWDVDEGRNAACAAEMLERGDWIVPSFNAELRVDKPALLYWLQILAYQLLGVNELAARLPSALAALATVLLTYELGRSLFGRSAGLLAGLIFACTPMVCASARFANPDALLNLFTVLALTLFWLGYASGGRCLYVAISVAMALAVLAKGPVGAVMPGAVIFGFLLWAGKLRLLRIRGMVLGTVAFALVALPWYILVGSETKTDFLRGFLLTHNVGRFLSPMENHRGGPLYYVLVLAAGFAPWSVFLGPTLWYARRKNPAEPQAAREGDPYRFLWCWLGVYLVFFTVSATKLPNYILPLCAPAAVLTAHFFDRWRRGVLSPPTWVLGTCLVGLALIGAATALGLAVAGGLGPVWLPPGRQFEGLERWAVLGVFPVLGAAAGAWCLRRRLRGGLVACVIVSALLLIGPLAAWGVATLDRYKAPRPLVAEAGALQRTRDISVGCYDLGRLPSLTFYCQRTVRHQNTPAEVLEFLQAPAPVYLFLPEPAWRDLAGKVDASCRVVGRHRDMYGSCEVVAVTNR
jgi:4-amino-4-deoxy-L-arabinose transferase-like glycosyltransferase